MTRGTKNDLLRLLQGELPPDEARELRARMGREPGLAEDFRRLERTWQGLALPPASPVPSGFAGRIMARARSQPAPGSLAWSAAPGWVRAAAAAALVTGAALGIGAGRSLPAAEAGPAAVPVFAAAEEEEDLSLAGSYWSVVEDATSDNSDNSDEEEARP